MADGVESEDRGSRWTRLAKWWPLLALVVMLAGFTGSLLLARKPPQTGTPGYSTAVLRYGQKTAVADVADTPAKQSLGLGGRDKLPQGRAMIFPYSKPGEQCFWMKDMRFPIDIVWLKSDKSVGHIEPSLGPETYPKTYCPDVAAQYVVELPAGAAKDAGLKTGDRISFDL